MTEKVKKTAEGKKSEVESKDITPATPHAVATVSGPVEMGRGDTGNFDAGDLVLPRAKVLQLISEEISEGLDGVKPGMIINSLTKTPLKEAFIPIFARKRWIKFNPSKGQPGYNPDFEERALVYSTDNPTAEQVAECEFGENGEKPIGAQSIDFLCLFDGEDMPCLMSFRVSSLKMGQTLLTLCSMRARKGEDFFAAKYKIKTKQVVDGKNTYFVPIVTPYCKVGTPEFTQEEYLTAESFFQTLTPQNIKVSEEN